MIILLKNKSKFTRTIIINTFKKIFHLLILNLVQLCEEHLRNKYPFIFPFQRGKRDQIKQIGLMKLYNTCLTQKLTNSDAVPAVSRFLERYTLVKIGLESYNSIRYIKTFLKTKKKISRLFLMKKSSQVANNVRLARLNFYLSNLSSISKKLLAYANTSNCLLNSE